MSITSFTLTLNEEKNIENCINSIKNFVDRMIVLDGSSTDNTVSLAKKLGSEVIVSNDSYLSRVNYALKQLDFQTTWVLFIDADEIIPKEAINEILFLTKKYENTDVNAIVFKYRITFLNKELRYGGNVLKKIAIFKPNTVIIDDTLLDQRTRLKTGRSIILKTNCIHNDFKGIKSWSQKHVNYAELAMKDYFDNLENRKNLDSSQNKNLGDVKKFLKYKLYYKLPMGLRAKIYYFYRYYLLFGFLDGKKGKIYIYLQAYWYRFLVDSLIFENKINEVKKR